MEYSHFVVKKYICHTCVLRKKRVRLFLVLLLANSACWTLFCLSIFSAYEKASDLIVWLGKWLAQFMPNYFQACIFYHMLLHMRIVSVEFIVYRTR
uniref:Uncharacterized protein n=1 Tax=Arundo donax TaxID=35708 RepID=A0A0A9DG73_ARUDO